ncbi:hypothetical protein GCM10010885_07110 [Alicyclobacillus cellulosilyticus]|uniref:Tat pathway signal sequence domain protein n=1 Tax=Alicyclobacillus cellulosilyticus TaxID=1003997 RepID=A0A917NHA2_9BACL|nr:hypothetical protein GCM10010885_07110 [Alicyclobacillus cellulosilyticus]
MKLSSTPLQWLGHLRPNQPCGVTFGVPWPRGFLNDTRVLRLIDSEDKEIPMQTWCTAYWPDGSVKWTAHAAVFGAETDGLSLVLDTARDSQPGGVRDSIQVTDMDNAIQVQSGNLCIIFYRNGTKLCDMTWADGKMRAFCDLAVCMERVFCVDEGRVAKEVLKFISHVDAATVEQKGPIRCVVKITGSHVLCNTHAMRRIPFIVRFYVYAGVQEIRVVHTFIYDSDACNVHDEYLRGVGINIHTNLNNDLYNRCIRVVGDSGVFSEAAKLLLVRGFDRNNTWYRQQIRFGQVDITEWCDNARFQDVLKDAPVWDIFQVFQDSSEHYVIRKRTKRGCAWVEAVHGQRAQGTVYIGGREGGLVVGLRDFWEKYPRSIDVKGLSQEQSTLTAWFWSPSAPAMDLRHYDTVPHVVSAYEGFNEMRSTPYGIANTNEVRIWFMDEIPSRKQLMEMARMVQTPPILICEPVRYKDAGIFGRWSLPDRTTPMRDWLEGCLDKALDFYTNEVKRRRWYGFWNYGDVMHTYDPVRHCWRYDMGGYAWQNTELIPNLWLWYTFLRTGRADVFRMAEAMTRHTSEVDVYHLGSYKGLGSRHNVVHWGCGCKEARISMAGLHRIYYYLTADERIGDILDEVKDAEFAVAKLDPMRAIFPPGSYATHIRSGPDWAAFCSNWLTQWERFLDEGYLQRIREGIMFFKQLPLGLCSGPTFGYDPTENRMHHIGDDNYDYHMVVAFGAPEIWIELADLLQDDDWIRLLADFGEFAVLPEEEKLRRSGGKVGNRHWNWPMLYARLVAFAAVQRHNAALAQQAWQLILSEVERMPLEPVVVPEDEWVQSIVELPQVSTNQISQWCLSVIECLEMIPEYLPEHSVKKAKG